MTKLTEIRAEGIKVWVNNEQVKVSNPEREVLREIIKAEKANLRVFSLPDKKEHIKYEKILERLDGKFA